MKKWANELNRALSKGDVQRAKITHEKIFNIPSHYGREGRM
jgi:hypothetical protein